MALGLVLMLAFGGCAGVSADPRPSVVDLLDEPALVGTRWGLAVMTDRGEMIAEARADDRFSPASVTKIFTTATAFAELSGLEGADPADGTSVRLAVDEEGALDVILLGRGDPMLADGAACVDICLSDLAEAVAARTREVDDVIGDDRFYPDERWGPGWSWEDLGTSFGTAVSALTVNDNIVLADVQPGAAFGDPVRAAWRVGDDLLILQNDAVTGAVGDSDLRLERAPGSNVARLHGRLGLESAPVALRIGLDDPALSAAVRFRRLLQARGVVVGGRTEARHRPLNPSGDPEARAGPLAETQDEGEEIARLPRGALMQSLQRIGKASQNLHAELMLRRLGRSVGAGSRADGLAAVERALGQAGVARAGWDIQDGSGMSVYNRVSPRATATFLLWSMHQDWGDAWRATLPVGGRDGTLARRFRGTPLEGRIQAKTGTLRGVNALAGFMTGASGRTLIFAIYANDRPSAAPSALPTMDRVLLAIAEDN